jgi:hypothetical protein
MYVIVKSCGHATLATSGPWVVAREPIIYCKGRHNDGEVLTTDVEETSSQCTSVRHAKMGESSSTSSSSDHCDASGSPTGVGSSQK